MGGGSDEYCRKPSGPTPEPEQQIMNAFVDVFYQQVNDLAGTFNSSIDHILVDENKLQMLPLMISISK